MNRYFKLLLVFVLPVILAACTWDRDNKEQSALSFLIPQQQYTVYTLPSELNEISGIAFKDSVNVLAIEDEDGYIFQYDLRRKKIVSRTEFAGKGDYEDLAIAGKDVYVVDSSGDLYRVVNFMTGKDITTIKLKTALKKKNDVEGLCFDKFNNRLLLAAKGKSVVEKKTKEIFAFDIATNTLDSVPVYSLPISEIENYFKGDAIEESSKKFLKALGNKNMNDVFTTSAIAIHPTSHDLYMLSSVNHLLAIVGPDNKLKKVIPLKGRAFIQPEGLAFGPGDKLYVSNEGRKKLPNIIRLEHEK